MQNLTVLLAPQTQTDDNPTIGFGECTVCVNLETVFNIEIKELDKIIPIFTIVENFPGKYILENGTRERRFGGIHETMEVTLYPTKNNIVRPYGIYNRQILNNIYTWVRIDNYEDFLQIDHTDLIQNLKPVITDSPIDGYLDFIKSSIGLTVKDKHLTDNSV